jgi:hypothetical protein
MISRLLPFIGTGGLLLLLAWLGVKAVEVYQAQPTYVAIPELSPTEIEKTAPVTQLQVTTRPEVYYAAITDRPLFEPGRRPFIGKTTAPEQVPEPVAEPPATAEPKELPPPVLSLQGVMTIDNNTVALIAINGSIPDWVSKGDPVSDWTLSEIGSDWVEISRKSRRIRVEMYK